MSRGKIIIASHNAGKVREIGELLAPLGYEAISAAELDLAEPEETGATFTENAAIKASAACEATGLAALADDSGLVIPALNGAPGIYSARWTGPERNYATAFARITRELEECGISPGSAPPAHFTCALCLAQPGEEPLLFEGHVRGMLTFPPRGTNGFGYDPIFIPEGHNVTFGEMPPAQKHGMSHRGDAFEQLVAFLREQR